MPQTANVDMHDVAAAVPDASGHAANILLPEEGGRKVELASGLKVLNTDGVRTAVATNAATWPSSRPTASWLAT